jgi:hypothetical protein
MAANRSSWLKEHATELLIIGIFGSALLYAVTSAYKNEQMLSSQSEQLSQIRGDLKEIKKSFISVLLDKNPDKSKIIERLVTNESTLEGVKNFKAGNYAAAYAIWVPSAQKGNKDSAVAIAVANAALEQRAADKSLSPHERSKVMAAMAGSASINIDDLLYKEPEK